MAGTVTGRRIAADGLLWGFILWLLGFALGMLVYPFVEERWIGIFVLPVLLPVTVWVAYRRLRAGPFPAWYPAAVGAVWAALAVALDWAFLVQAFDVEGYYDADVVAYYILALAIPVVVGALLRRRAASGPRQT